MSYSKDDVETFDIGMLACNNITDKQISWLAT